MRICLVGGIFDRGEALRAKHALTPETVLLDGFRKAGVDVHAVGHAGFEPSDAYDVVHVHHFGRAALKMAASPGPARFVFTGHNGLIVTGYERSALRRRAFHYVVGKADAMVALSEAEARYFRARLDPATVHVIPNGIPAEVFQARPDAVLESASGAGAGRYEILYVGQLIDWKGVDYLLRALQQLRRKWDLRLRLVYHNAHLEGALRRLARELVVADQVDFVGILGPAELAAAYRQADLLVLPSFADCLPSVVTEALLCGTPVVAGAVCGVPEQVGDYGRVVPPGNVEALAAAIDGVLQDRQKFRVLAAEMRSYAARKFSPETMVGAHLDLYANLLAGRTGTVRRAGWLDPLIRCAIKAYWLRARRGA
jgi:glycosyltransferase involved in cell wall biosynthesis